MTTITVNRASADLLALGVLDLRRCSERDRRNGVGAPRVAPFQGSGAPATGLPAGPVPCAHNSIGTTLGIPPSGRPLS